MNRAKQYLLQIRRLDIVINQKVGEIERIRSQLDGLRGIDYTQDKVQSSLKSADAGFTSGITRIDELEREISASLNTKHQIIRDIQSIKEPNRLTVLYSHYVEYKSLQEIAGDMCLSVKYVYLIHGEALKDMDQIIAHREKT